MKDRQEQKLEIAAFRYRIIAEAAEANGVCVTSAIEDAAKNSYFHPNGHTLVTVSKRTLWQWLRNYKRHGLRGLCPKQRKNLPATRVISPAILEKAIALRKEDPDRATKTVIDILERLKRVKPHTLKRSTLDWHFDHHGVSRRQLHRLGTKVFKKILTTAPLELVVADFHHGPYVRLAGDDQVRRALMLCFIDHYSRYILEGRYYLHEDFAALRFGFRRVLLLYGPFKRLYIDNGPSFQTTRFHAACKNEALNVEVVHSKAYTSEGRGVVERYNRTLKEQFETEVKHREELLTLDELNAFHEAWLAERYHTDIHSETQEAPFERFRTHAILREPPTLECIDELLRLRKRVVVHKKYSTVEVQTIRYCVDPSLRGRHVFVLYDAFDTSSVLIEWEGRILQRALPQKPGETPMQPEETTSVGPKTDYLKLLRSDYEARMQAELSALQLRTPENRREINAVDFEALYISCRGKELLEVEKEAIRATFRALRPIEPNEARAAVKSACRRFGTGLHIGVYLDDVKQTLLKQRMAKGKKQ